MGRLVGVRKELHRAAATEGARLSLDLRRAGVIDDGWFQARVQNALALVVKDAVLGHHVVAGGSAEGAESYAIPCIVGDHVPRPDGIRSGLLLDSDPGE